MADANADAALSIATSIGAAIWAIFFSATLGVALFYDAGQLRFLTFWVLCLHVLNNVAVLVLYSAKERRCLAWWLTVVVPTIDVLAWTVLFTFMTLLFIYPTQMLDSDSFAAMDVVMAEGAHVAVHLMPVFNTSWIRSTFTPRGCRRNGTTVNFESRFQRGYVLYLHVITFGYIYGAIYRPSEVSDDDDDATRSISQRVFLSSSLRLELTNRFF
ncbi:hypothetical protein CYMTET_26598 [Cymbomonas tetramitiformis]|uniref:Transmembrane protein n=1 Tax=Cymbomonas tetramitiformis TaxID=36881 RepID=A0AAE0KXS0_9CHLO|nr:hypothetical protein CYMTET_26598 [Cymbomonas tetramitiformis]